VLTAEGKGVEVATALRKHQLTDADEFGWRDFSIMSYASGASPTLMPPPPPPAAALAGAWIMHFACQVRPLQVRPDAGAPREQRLPLLLLLSSPHQLARHVPSDRLYHYLGDAGIHTTPVEEDEEIEGGGGGGGGTGTGVVDTHSAARLEWLPDFELVPPHGRAHFPLHAREPRASCGSASRTSTSC